MQTQLDILLANARGLAPERVMLLIEMAKAMGRKISSRVGPGSNIVTSRFDIDFTGRLLIFHAMHDAPLTKKTFEYFFCGASRASGKQANQTENSVHPGEDITVDGQKFSLKTESGKSIKRDEVHISKLMEARWIRECRSQADFSRMVSSRVVEHLSGYERIVSLRSFCDTSNSIEYQLVEIPMATLRLAENLKPSDFSTRTDNGSSSARVLDTNGRIAFTLALDGSVEKVTIRSLQMRACQVHAHWKVELS